jgi:hypothetical protein
MSINTITMSGRVMWIQFKSDEYDSLNILFSAPSGDKKKPDEKYPPSITCSVRITGAYAKALAKYADHDGPLHITATGKLGSLRTQSREGTMEVAPISILYPDIDIVPIGNVSDADAPVEVAATTKKKTKAATPEADTADLFD